jgi:hypothetical protein
LRQSYGRAQTATSCFTTQFSIRDFPYNTEQAVGGGSHATELLVLHCKGVIPTRDEMVDADYLRQQAERCLRWGRQCYDLATAERLRLMAEEFIAKAAAIESHLPPKISDLTTSHDAAANSIEPIKTGSDGT